MRNRFESYRPESDQVEGQVDQVDAVELENRVREAQPVTDQTSGTTNVELGQINDTDIQSAGDFRNPEQYNGMRREAEMLKQMQPALEQGATADTFDDWDKANQIGHYSPGQYERGYVDAYHSYHGSEAVALDPKADGTYDVINGRHRIVAARDAGLVTIPAKVLG